MKRNFFAQDIFTQSLKVLLCGALLLLTPMTGWGQIIISQIYGGGGQAGAVYQHDYVELFNPGTTPVTMTNWSVQYSAATGTSFSGRTAITGTIPPRRYFLVQLAGTAVNGSALPTPDAVGLTDLSAAAGKVALATDNVIVTFTAPGTFSSNVIDFVGYGSSANAYEGSSPAPSTTTTNSIFRRNGGCTDSNRNSEDFAVSSAVARNLQSPAATPCASGTAPISTGFTPVSGRRGTVVIISGANLSGITAVNFAGVAATNVVATTTEVRATVATGTPLGAAAVVLGNGATAYPVSGTFQVEAQPAPLISGFAPASGTVGATVTISGTDLDGATAVQFNGTAATSYTASVNSITAVVPSGATTGPLTVTTPGGSVSSTQAFVVENPIPVLSSLSPTTRPAGSGAFTLTANGMGFAATSVIRFSGTDLVTTFVSATQLTAIVPAAFTTTAGVYSVVVRTPAPGGGLSAAVPFNVTGAFAGLLEPFEQGSKTSYTTGVVSFFSGDWELNDALIGNTPSDPRNGTQSVRIRNTGLLAMVFDKSNGAGDITLQAANYAGDPNGAIVLEASTNQGTTWTAVGNPVTIASTNLTTFSFTANLAGNIRLRVRKTAGVRITIDDVSITDYIPAVGPEIDLVQSTTAIASGGSYDFGFATIGSSITTTFIIRNLGSETLLLTNPPVQLNGSSAFTLGMPPASVIVSGGTAAFTVSFTPTTSSASTATLIIGSNDGNESAYTVMLTGAVPPTYRWNGSGTSWSASSSWTPARVAPGSNDALLFDGTTVPTAIVSTDFISPQSIGQLLLQNGVAVTFINTDSRTLIITNSTNGADLRLAANTTLTLTNPGATAAGLLLQMGPGATAAIMGRIAFEASNANTGGHRLLGSGTNSVEFLAGSSFRSGSNATGSPFGNTTTYAGSVLFRDGSRLEQAGGGQPFALTAPGSVILLDPVSQYVYSVPTSNSTAPLSGRTFGNLEFNVGNGTTTGSTANSPLMILGNLLITSGNVGLNLDSDISIGGNVTVNAGSSLRFVPAEGGPQTVTLDGTTVQTLAGSGGLIFGSTAQLRLANAAGVMLARPLTLTRLQLSNGLLGTSATNLLTLVDGASISEGSNNSYVNGPVARQVGPIAAATDVLFPVGKNSSYRPATLRITSQTGTTTYVAELQNASAATTTLEAPLARVSRIRYMQITPTEPPVGFRGTITLTFGADDQVTDPAALVVAKRIGTGPWQTLSRSGSTGTPNGGLFVTGSITSAPFTSFSDFALASLDPNSAINPLPVQLVAFNAHRATSGVRLTWQTAAETNSHYFEVQRSLDAHDFRLIATLEAKGTASVYALIDATAPVQTLSYYRLRQVDKDGQATYSAVQAISGTSGPTAVSLYPIPAHNQLQVHLSRQQTAGYRIVTLVGVVVQAGELTTEVPLSIATLPAGSYFIELNQAQERTIRRFQKVE